MMPAFCAVLGNRDGCRLSSEEVLGAFRCNKITSGKGSSTGRPWPFVWMQGPGVGQLNACESLGGHKISLSARVAGRLGELNDGE